MRDLTDKLVGFITVSGEKEAQTIARSLVVEKLAACVNVVPSIRSIYRWEGEIHDEAECLLIVKTSKEKFEAIKGRVLELHSYEIPEIIALPIVSGNKKYLDWITENLG